jgi:hypothetical protein
MSVIGDSAGFDLPDVVTNVLTLVPITIQARVGVRTASWSPYQRMKTPKPTPSAPTPTDALGPTSQQYENVLYLLAELEAGVGCGTVQWTPKAAKEFQRRLGRLFIGLDAAATPPPTAH